MLIDDIQKSRELGEKYKKASVSENHLKDVEHIKSKISEILPLVAEVFAAVNDIELIKESKGTFANLQIPTIEIERLKSQLAALKEELGDLTREQVIKKLEDITFLKDQSSVKLEQEWGRYRSENYTKNANVIHSLLNIIDNDPRMDELASLGKAIVTKKIGDMKTVEQIDKYRKISKEIIKDLGMKPEVEDFVMKLSRGEELYLSAVSEETMKWLLEHNNVAGKIKLSI